jgi:hypothetical protein
MAALYRKEVLGEKAPEGGFVPLGAIGGLGGITPAPKATNVEVVTQIEETVSGD